MIETVTFDISLARRGARLDPCSQPPGHTKSQHNVVDLPQFPQTHPPPMRLSNRVAISS
jgi:hypothetical protein